MDEVLPEVTSPEVAREVSEEVPITIVKDTIRTSELLVVAFSVTREVTWAPDVGVARQTPAHASTVIDLEIYVEPGSIMGLHPGEQYKLIVDHMAAVPEETYTVVLGDMELSGRIDCPCLATMTFREVA